jgi:hypothetical protein
MLLADLEAVVRVARYVRMHPPHAPDAPLPWPACVATAANILGLYDAADSDGIQAAALTTLMATAARRRPADAS